MRDALAMVDLVAQDGPIILVTISSTLFYRQLLRTQIPKSTKKTDRLTVFFALLGSARIKDARKTLMILTPGGIQQRRLGLDLRGLS